MIKSMTGFGEAKGSFAGFRISVSIRGVNHRYLEPSFRLPYSYSFLTDKLKALTSEYAARGKIDLSLNIDSDGTVGREVFADLGLAKAYYTALESVRKHLGIVAEVSLANVLKNRDILLLTEDEEKDSQEIWGFVKEVASAAFSDFVAMREAEGENLAGDIKQSLSRMEGYYAEVKLHAEESIKLYEEKMYAKLCEILENKDFENDRILMEVAIFADKISINEELVRLESHTKMMEDLLESDGAIGRKMDFLAQEMNREINTIGAKSQKNEISQLVVEMKSELEKIREQVQNIE